MNFTFSAVLRRRVLRAPAVLLVLAACSDASAPTAPAALPEGALQMLRCEASVATGELSCTDAALGAVSASRSPRGGPSLEQRTIGGQGTYVRLAGSGIISGDGQFRFDVTVQNLTNLWLATTDGLNRHPDGVRVVFSDGPTATGGSGEVTLANPTGYAMYSGPDQPYFQYGGTVGGVDQTELGSDGMMVMTETSWPKTWQFQVDEGVTRFGFSVYVHTETREGELRSIVPRITGISADTLQAGGEAVISGSNFWPDVQWNRVYIGNVRARVTGGSDTELHVVVPCIHEGPVTVQVDHGSMTSGPVPSFVTPPRQALQVGQSVLIENPNCTELTPTDSESRYLIGAFSYGPPNLLHLMRVAGNSYAFAGVDPVRSTLPSAAAAPAARPQGEDARHQAVLEGYRTTYARMRSRAGGSAGPRLNVRAASAVAPPPATRTFKVINPTVAAGCSQYYVVNATRVFYDGKIAIYEDDATAPALRAGANPAMQAYYDRLGAEYNADMEPLLRVNFGDPLRRDTDLDGVLMALFTPRVNAMGFTGFVSGCDLYMDDDAAEPAVGGPYSGGAGTANAGSNYGDLYIGRVPTATGTGYGAETPDEWYRLIRTNLVHEVKHWISLTARVANGAPDFEEGSVEEGSARLAQELWARRVDGLAWKGDAGYGSAAEPMGMYCDLRPTSAACNANPLRPALTMDRHFTRLYTALSGVNTAVFSGLGRTPEDNGSYFWALGWSQVRYAADRYAGPEAEFLTQLTQSSGRGWRNMAALAGFTPRQFIADWHTAVATDGLPGFGNPFPSWDLRDVFAGLHADAPATYTRPHPLQPEPVTFGPFDAVWADAYGGGVRWVELSGTHTEPQLITMGFTTGADVGLVIVRVQ